MASNRSTGMQPASMDIDTHVNGGLDPARTALVLVHMVKGVAGDVDTPFNQLFRRRAEENGIIEVQARLLRAFRAAEAKVLYTAVNYKQGLPGVRPISPLWRTLFDCVCLMEGTPAVEVIDDVAPRPDEPVVRGQAANGFDRTELDTILRLAGVDNLVLGGIATDVAVESTVRGCKRPRIPHDRRLRRLHRGQRRGPRPLARRDPKVVRRDAHRRRGPQRPGIRPLIRLGPNRSEQHG